MHQNIWKKSTLLLGGFAAIWLGIRYLLPLFLPFLSGALLAFSAEPLVKFLQSKLRLPRIAAAGIGITLSLVILILLAFSLGALLLRELTAVAGSIPQARELVSQALDSLQQWLNALAGLAPAGISRLLTRITSELFSGGATLLAKVTDWLLGIAGTLLSFYLVFVSAYSLLTPLALQAFLLLWTLPVLLMADRSGRY
jgi:predicted PurR-regulated permease PerM